MTSETATKSKANQPTKKKNSSEEREIKSKQRRKIDSDSDSDEEEREDCGQSTNSGSDGDRENKDLTEKVPTKAAIVTREETKKKQVGIGAPPNQSNNDTLDDVRKRGEVADITSPRKSKNVVQNLNRMFDAKSPKRKRAEVQDDDSSGEDVDEDDEIVQYKKMLQETKHRRKFIGWSVVLENRQELIEPMEHYELDPDACLELKTNEILEILNRYQGTNGYNTTDGQQKKHAIEICQALKFKESFAKEK
jgi:hypothetical protein